MPSAELSEDRLSATTWLANESMVALNEMLAVPPRAELRPLTGPPVRPASADGQRTPTRAWADNISREQESENGRPKTAV
ncbi:hypothetical protein PFICI_06983 [Pestalotiopsis fici W106-1]|uniref:Uncharacterized protein n=1 Tax=Pestalotiopsis fici (strain W106-1 / CGMCC3.15140) TaxID=1229662 RepID=W3X9Y2_PESFW|nr:uncharacterized protein PFICI_06983 [Pestalotiopsis fici W106-1]ETS81981.1 hypothetical protein PFICI_06983 [Pestalotiopsis fici W106-1]